MINVQVRKLFFFPLATCYLLLTSCSINKQIARSAKEKVINDSSLLNAHLGISIYEPSTGKYWYNYNGDKYFVPASNTKIPTCYAAMKYLGDSLVGLKYSISEKENGLLAIQPTGDPTFLHSDFIKQPVWSFLSQNAKQFPLAVLDTIWKDERWGSGWSWNDYDADYMAERSSFPIFGNVLQIKVISPKNRYRKDTSSLWMNFIKTQSHLFDSIINNNLYVDTNMVFNNDETILSPELHLTIHREIDINRFSIVPSENKLSDFEMPFVTNGNNTARWIIQDSLKNRFGSLEKKTNNTEFVYYCPDCRARTITINKWYKVHSRPTDSLLKPMMHRSDNFFAEQSLLMVSNERLGIMNDEKIIDTLLKTDLKDLPQKPRWVDGSGLSRYNLFTPQDFVAILNKMRNEFGMDRIEKILPTGGEGTISNYYKADSGFIYGKTGTLSGVVAFSGFLYTKKGKLLIFSTLVNNHNNASSSGVRRAIEKFIEGVRNNY